MKIIKNEDYVLFYEQNADTPNRTDGPFDIDFKDGDQSWDIPNNLGDYRCTNGNGAKYIYSCR